MDNGGDGVASRLPHVGLVALLVTVIALGIATRMSSRRPAATCEDGTWIASTPGYWVPFLGHVPQMAWDTDGYLARMREKFPRGVFSLNLLGQVHTFVHRPSMAIMLMNKPQTVADEAWISEHLMISNFGFSKADRALFRTAFADIHANYKQLLAGQTLAELVDKTANNLRRTIPDFISLNTYPSDQMEWERLADVDVVETPAGEKVVEANLNELIKNFVARTASPALFGTDFVDNFPEFAQHIWAFDEAFVLLAMNLPGWIPWPPLARARRERGKALAAMKEFHEAYDKYLSGEDPGARWQDMDNVSPLVRARTEAYRKHGISLGGRAACEFSLYWAMNANSAPLVFWMVLEICRDPVLLADVRAEIAPYVEGIQPKNEFGVGVWLAPKLAKMDVEALLTKCPLFKSAYVETMRLYTGVWSIKWITEDTTLKESGRGGESFLLRKGTYAHAPQEVHQLDPRFFPEPEEWKGGRHVKETTDEKGNNVLTAELGTIRPYGGGHAMCKGRAFALRELLMFTAAILTMYDIEPANGGQWKVPKTVKQAATKHPAKPVRVWVKRRKLPVET